MVYYEEKGIRSPILVISFSFLFVKNNEKKGLYVMLENKFKTKLVEELEKIFPGCIVVHLDPNEIQGIPDLLVLYKNKWAALEGKKSANERHQPNQDYYVDLMNRMSFAAFIYPENKEEVLYELQKAFCSRRTTRFSRC